MDHAFRQTGIQDNNDKFGGVTSFKYYGELLEPELSNLHILTAGIGRRFGRRMSLDLIYHNYRQDEALYDTDYYSEFLVAPARLITDRMRNWIAEAELCARVLDSGSLVEPTHSLEGHITRLYGDYRDKDARKAIMEIRLYLISHKDLGQAILLGKTYAQTEPVNDPDGETLVNVASGCYSFEFATGD